MSERPLPPAEYRFKPGQSGNPGGRARGKLISTWMLEFGEMTPDEIKRIPADKLPVNARIALARIRAALKAAGGESSTNIILDRTEGKVVQVISGPDGSAVPLNITLSDDRGGDAST